jgi:hypothetical protein
LSALGADLGLCSEKPATDHLCCGMARMCTNIYQFNLFWFMLMKHFWIWQIFNEVQREIILTLCNVVNFVTIQPFGTISLYLFFCVEENMHLIRK